MDIRTYGGFVFVPLDERRLDPLARAEAERLVATMTAYVRTV